MYENDQLLLQVYIICVLLAFIGMTAVVRHPDWFGGAAFDWELAAPQSPAPQSTAPQLTGRQTE